VTGQVTRRRPAPSPDLRGIKTLYAALGAGVGTLLPYLVLYLTWRGLSPSQAGLLVGLMAGVGVLAVPAWGLLADRVIGVVAALRLSCLVAAAASLALLVAGESLPAIVGCAALLAAARAPGEALADTLALGALGPSGAQHYGSIRLWASIGFAVAVAGWGLVLDHSSLALILLAYPLALLVELASAGGARTVPVRARAAGVAGVRIVNGRFAVLLAGALLFGVAMGASVTVLPLRITDTGGDLVMVGAAGVVGALAEIPLMRCSALLRERLGAHRVFLAGGALFGPALLLYGVVGNPAGLVAASAVRGAGYAVVYVGLVTAAGALLPADRQASGQALLQTTLMGVATTVGASLGGVAYQHEPPGLLFGAAAVLAVVGTVVCQVGARSLPRRVGDSSPRS
jgi:predicted MFS family arabinose efflux permease